MRDAACEDALPVEHVDMEKPTPPSNRKSNACAQRENTLGYLQCRCKPRLSKVAQTMGRRFTPHMISLILADWTARVSTRPIHRLRGCHKKGIGGFDTYRHGACRQPSTLTTVTFEKREPLSPNIPARHFTSRTPSWTFLRAHTEERPFQRHTIATSDCVCARGSDNQQHRREIQ